MASSRDHFELHKHSNAAKHGMNWGLGKEAEKRQARLARTEKGLQIARLTGKYDSN
jgi:hypothetical protein